MSSNHTISRFVRAVLAAAAALAFILPFAACGSGGTAAQGLTKVTFMNWWAPDTNHIGVYVAQNKGYYREAGLDVTIVPVSQAGSEQAVNTGAADFSISTMTNVSVYDAKGAHITMVMQMQQKPSAIWCSLASNTAISSPKDFDGKTFATFGSSESDAVVRRMIQHDGGSGDFDKVTVGTSTFQALQSGRADFGGFYSTWEGVQAQLHGPELNCFTEPDYGVPGNADSIGVITSEQMVKNDPKTVRAFVEATKRGYEYAYSHPDDASEILAHEAPDANLELDLVKASMKTIVDGEYWGSRKAIADGSFTFGMPDTMQTQAYFDFLAQEDAYTDADGKVLHTAPSAKSLSTGEFVQ